MSSPGRVRVYLDHHAATPPARAADEAWLEARRAWANPSSVHAEGRSARAILERARDGVAEALGVRSADVVLTAGGTEACNLGVLGLAEDAAFLGSGGVAGLHVHASAIEHPAIDEALRSLAARGALVVRHDLSRDPGGHPRFVDAAEASVRAGAPVLVAVQAVNHETGTVHDVEALSLALGRDPSRVRGVVDASQGLGKVDVLFGGLGFAVAVAGAKLGGPAGTGALYVPRELGLASRQLGGAQERGRRAGTPDVAALAALGAAAGTVKARLADRARIGALRDRLEAGVRALVPAGEARVNGDHAPRVETVTSLALEGWRGTLLVAALDLEGVAVSAGAACSSGVDAPSPVVRALHPDEPWRASSTVRASLGLETTGDDVDRALEAFARVLARRKR